MKKWSAILFLLMGLTAQAATITGTITDASSGSGLAGVAVTLSGFGQNGGGQIASDTTDADGNYAFSDLATGGMVISAILSGYTPATDFVLIQDAAQEDVIDLELTAVGEPGTGTASISGAVTSSAGDEPVAGAKVVLSLQAGWQTGSGTVIDSAQTNAQGEYAFADLPAGRYSLAVTADGFQDAGGNTFRVDDGQAVTRDISLDAYVAPAGVITGTVTDADTDAPLAGAVVTLRTGVLGGGGIAWESVSSTPTDAAGVYLFGGLGQGAFGTMYSIVVSMENYNSDNSDFIDVTGDTARVDIALTAVVFGSLRVFVGDAADSSALAGATVAAALRVQDGAVYTGTAGNDGWIVFADAASGDYSVTASMDGYIVGTAQALVPEGGSDTARVLLDAAGNTDVPVVFTGTVTSPDGAPVSGADVMVQTGRRGQQITLTGTTDAGGIYSLSAILPTVGNVTITIKADGYETYNAAVIMAGDTVTHDAELIAAIAAIGPVAFQSNITFHFDPASHNIFVGNITGPALLTVHTPVGKLVERRSLTAGGNVIHLGERGIYPVVYVRIQSDKSQIVRTLTVP